MMYGVWSKRYTWVKMELIESHEPAILAKQCSEPTKFLFCDLQICIHH